MNKKTARKRKKLINQIRDHRVLPNGRILTHDGRETLLGNLNPVKHIPMLPWKHVIAFPTVMNNISVAVEGKNAWFYNMLEKATHQTHDLIGFTPVKTLDSTTFDQTGEGSVGMAVQVVKIDPPENGRAIVHLKGICRYENIGYLPSTEDHFNIKIRWFEDDREADSLLRPEVEKCLKIFRTIAEIMNNAGIEGFKNRTPIDRYNIAMAQYMSFSLIEGTQRNFEEEEKRELLLLRSTSQRFKILNEYFERLLTEVERRFKNRSQI
jgi:Lon protease-like protein